MRAIISIAMLLVAAPAFAAGAPAITATPAAVPASPAVAYEVWVFKWDGAGWVRQPNYTFQSTDLTKAADYLTQIDRYAGWTATANFPAPAAKAPRYVSRGMARDRLAQSVGNGSMQFNIGGYSISIPYSLMQNAGASDDDSSSSSDNWSNYSWPNNSDTSDIQNTIATQDMINAQLQNDNMQENLDAQNFENTENMINTQEAFNAQMGP